MDMVNKLRLRLAVRLFSNRSQMTSKYGKNKEAIDVFTTF